MCVGELEGLERTSKLERVGKFTPTRVRTHPAVSLMLKQIRSKINRKEPKYPPETEEIV